MITTEEAKRFIEEQVRDFGVEEIPLLQATGRVLREPLIADRDFPPFDRITMDGIAVSYNSFEMGMRTFKIEGVVAAGSEKSRLRNADSCLEVMTGAVMPDGADTVIPYEQVLIEGGSATVKADHVVNGQNIHRKGTDRRAGAEIVAPGRILTAVEIAVAASIGKHRVKVSKNPKVIFLSSGDELVPVDQEPKPHQIRKSNVYQLMAVLDPFALQLESAHISDDYDVIVRSLKGHLEHYDVLVLSGGVSKGKFDFIPQALEELGVRKHFHRVAQRPGKPFWFGTHENQSVVFAFPGNPVSSFMCMHLYLVPWLRECLQVKSKKEMKACLSETVTFNRDLTYFVQVSLSVSEKGELLALPLQGNGSGDFANLVEADAFMILPRGKDIFEAGEYHHIVPFR
jgi:molybdopterin molybdotransferase